MKIFHFSCIYLQLCFRMSAKRLPCVMLVLDRLPKEIGTCVPLTHFAETTSLAWLCHISTRIIPHFHMRRRNFKSCRLVFLHTHTLTFKSYILQFCTKMHHHHRWGEGGTGIFCRRDNVITGQSSGHSLPLPVHPSQTENRKISDHLRNFRAISLSSKRNETSEFIHAKYSISHQWRHSFNEHSHTSVHECRSYFADIKRVQSNTTEREKTKLLKQAVDERKRKEEESIHTLWKIDIKYGVKWRLTRRYFATQNVY